MAISKFNYNSFNVTPVASKALAFNSDADGFTTASSSSMILIKTLTASSSATLSFVDGADSVVLDDTYPIYKFEFINIHPQTDNVGFSVNFRDGETAYDATKTTTNFYAFHDEADSNTAVEYRSSQDIAQGTGFLNLGIPIGADADQNFAGELTLFNPSSTTFVKHFISNSNISGSGNDLHNNYIAGYCNVTAAIDGVQFKMVSGNIDAGKIKLYGIKDSWWHYLN